jgi:hypothetical protein
MGNSVSDQLQAIEREIQSAQIEVEVRERQLAELRPKARAIEEECKVQFGCTIKQLPAVIADMKAKHESAVAALVIEIEEAKAS